jgi:hypothetical protein
VFSSRPHALVAMSENTNLEWQPTGRINLTLKMFKTLRFWIDRREKSPDNPRSEIYIALFLDQRFLGKRIQHRFAFIEGNFVFEFGSGCPDR